MRKLSLKARLLALFLLVGVLPFAIVAVTAYWIAGDALEEQAFNQLLALRDTKKQQIEKEFERCRDDVNVLVETAETVQRDALRRLSAIQTLKKKQVEDCIGSAFQVVAAIAESKDAMDSFEWLKEYRDKERVGRDEPLDVTSGEYRALHEKVTPFLDKFVNKLGFRDVYLICAEKGHIVYAHQKRKDLGETLDTGKLRDEGLGRLWRKVVKTDAMAFEDFSPYSPWDGKESAFIGAPIHDARGKTVAVVALQMPNERIDAIVQERAGLGKSGETYLLGRRDGKIVYCSDRTVGSKKIGQSRPDDEEFEAALDGKTFRGLKRNPQGILEMAVYSKLDVPGVDWCIVSTENAVEVLAPRLEGEQEDFFAKYLKDTGYYDLFLFDPSGDCFYTVGREADFGTNFSSGKFADSNLGRLFRKVLKTKEFGIVDFEPYAPSKGQQAAFVAQPILSENGDAELVVALQLSEDRINAIMASRTGLGETGCTYLVGRDTDGQIAFRSDLTFMKDDYTLGSKISTPYIEKAMESAASKGHGTFQDSLGNDVIVAYDRVNAAGLPWAVVGKIDGFEAFAAMHSLRWVIAVIGVVGVIGISIIGWWSARSIANPINEIIGSLGAGADQTTSAAGQVSAASQSLAQGSSEQAASLEETTSSMEVLDSMTKQNAANANEAKKLAESASSSSERGTDAMERMSAAISDIKQSSDETAKIINTINEIAFQTNLLALNAAVEAARAGEAGKGFAVVAEEVRNLAQRSAEAARNTADMIEGSVKNADNGVEISKEVAEALGEIAEGSRKVNELVGEIDAASSEQSAGIGEINGALSQMDQVTQANAANAEESASAAEELNSQAEELRRMVADLQEIIGGKGAVRHHEGDRSPEPQTCRYTVAKGKSLANDAAQKREEAPASEDKSHEDWLPLESDSELAKF